MSTERLMEQALDQRKEIERLQIALLNANAIAQTFAHQSDRFDELLGTIDKINRRLGNLEQEVGNQRQMIVKSLQQTYGNGPTA